MEEEHILIFINFKLILKYLTLSTVLLGKYKKTGDKIKCPEWFVPTVEVRVEALWANSGALEIPNICSCENKQLPQRRWSPDSESGEGQVSVLTSRTCLPLQIPTHAPDGLIFNL